MKCPYCIKKCSKCGRLLVANTMNFHKKKGGKWGLRKDCKECCNKYQKQYYRDNKNDVDKKHRQYHKDNKNKINERHRRHYQNNKEEEREKQKQYYQNNKEKVNKKHKQHYQNNKEQINEKHKQYYCNNKDWFKEYHKEYDKKYYDEHREDILKRCKEYKENNPEKAFNNNNKRRLREESQGRGITKEQWLEMMNFFDWKCAYSGITLSKETRTVDHVVSLNKNGEHEIWNLVPMYKPYNSSKGVKDMLEWYKEQPFYSEERLNKIYEWVEYAKNKYQNS